MSSKNTLPFPRGGTWSDYGLSGQTLDDNSGDSIIGQEFTVRDTEHGTAQQVTLRVVKNDSASAITAGRLCYKFSATTEITDYGCRVVVNDTAGGPAWPMDDAYHVDTGTTTLATSIPAYDLFYIVMDGPCDVKGAATTFNVTAGTAATTDNAGCVATGAAAAGNFVLGAHTETSTTADEVVVINVGGRITDSDAAG